MLQTMAHFVFVTAGITSYVHRLAALSSGLLDRGHRVSVYSQRASGPDNWPAGVIVRRLDLPAHFPRRPGRVAEWRRRTGEERVRAEKIVRGDVLVSALENAAPDLVVIDYELHAQIIQALARAYPLMLLEYECSPLQTGLVPMPSSSHVPGPGGCSRWRSRLSWWGGLARRRARLALSGLYYGDTGWWSTIRAVAEREDFDLTGRTSRRHWHYLTYPEIPTLYLAPAALDFPNEEPNPDFRVGPVAGMDRRENLEASDYQRVLEALDGRPEAPVVYCAMGSILSDPGYFQRVIGAFEARPEWTLILAAGRHADAVRKGCSAGNVQVLGHAPQLDVLRRADLMLTHAGPASIYEAILSGVPLICYSGGAKEENGNAARVLYHGLGLRGNLRRDSPRRIGARIAQVLSEPGYKSRVTAMRDRMLVQHETDRGAELLERAAAEGPGALQWRAFR
jgi:UDP:flavonoid glycosyltransferase YjiC (YdhE family)